MHSKSLIEDEELLRSLQKGSVDAFNILYREYSEEIAYKIRRLVKLELAVEEIHQDVFIRFWNHRDRLVSDTNIKAYLYTITKNLVVDFYRKSAKDKVIQQELIHYIQESYDHIEGLLFEKEGNELLNKIISELPVQRQKVYRMIKMEGKTYADAAAYFEVSLSTIKDHMAKSSQFIKTTLKEKYPDLLIYLIIASYF